MLRVSSQSDEDANNLDAIVGGDPNATGIPGAAGLVEFAEAALGDDTDLITAARERVRAELGDDCTVDAAGIIANFQRMVRIADGTGISLDEPMTAMTAEIRDELGLNGYGQGRGLSNA